MCVTKKLVSCPNYNIFQYFIHTVHQHIPAVVHFYQQQPYVHTFNMQYNIRHGVRHNPDEK